MNFESQKQPSSGMLFLVCILVFLIGGLVAYIVFVPRATLPIENTTTSEEKTPVEVSQTSSVSTPSTSPQTSTIAHTSPEISFLAFPQLIQDQSSIFGKSTAADGWESSVTLYKTGTFVSGRYSGFNLLSAQIMLGMGSEHFRFASRGKELVLLKKYSGSIDDLSVEFPNVRSRFSSDENYTIPGFEPLKSFKSPDGTLLFLTDRVFLGSSPGLTQEKDMRYVVPVFEDARMGTVFTTAPDYRTSSENFLTSNAFYVFAPDKSYWTYEMKIPFVNVVNGFKTPDITWNSRTKNTDQYIFETVGGCGSKNFYHVVTDIDLEKDLTPAGKTVNGETVYTFKNVNDKHLQSLYESSDSSQYESNGLAVKISYSSFLAKKPLFYWKDPFGRLIEFKNASFVQPAECGKPVIYLYPQKAQRVSVRVEPKGGMTYSDPIYDTGTGWNVFTTTDSQITDLRDGKKFPYLFWEGRGGMYEEPKRGFVVARSDVHEFLIEKLAVLGLNAKESADFMEFWEPRMQSAPYYFVGFHGTAAMNSLAPLTITPKPDTVVRILMDFQPLQKPIKVEEPRIRTPERKGFTVIEWGGVIR